MHSQLIIRPDIFDRATGNGPSCLCVGVLGLWVCEAINPRIGHILAPLNYYENELCCNSEKLSSV